MQVILTKDVDSLGESGELHTVSDGFARNYLLPRSLAVTATPGALKDLQLRIERIKQKAEKKNQADLAKAKKLESLGTLTLAVRAGEQGKLYGVVTTKELSKLLEQKLPGVEIDRKNIKLNHPINRLGDYELQVRFSPKVTSTLKISVVADEDSSVDADYSTESLEDAGDLI